MTDDYDWQTKQAAQELARTWLAGHDEFERRLEQLIEDRERDSSRSVAKARQYVYDIVSLFRARVGELEAIVGSVPIVYAPILAEAHEHAVALNLRLTEATKELRALRTITQAEEADGDKVRVTIGAKAGWDVASLEELCYRIRCGGGEDLTKVLVQAQQAVVHLPFPNLMPIEPMRPTLERNWSAPVVTLPRQPLTFPNPVAPEGRSPMLPQPPINWILGVLSVLLVVMIFVAAVKG